MKQMIDSAALQSRTRFGAGALVLLASPAVLVFLSSNVVNIGNLAFNMAFSRWMGPELFGDLALVLTIKLAILGVLGAVQMASSQIVADVTGSRRHDRLRALARLNRILFVGLWFALPVAGVLLYVGDISAKLGLESPHLLLILLLSLPFSGPLALLRGSAFGAERSGLIVLSANVEMGVRLLGACLAWQAGWGIEGVVGTIALSIATGWAVLRTSLPAIDQVGEALLPVVQMLFIAAGPFAVLQLAQVAALDGDIFLAKAGLPAEEAGYIGALSLFQRIAFFACFALASVLLPGVVSAARDGGSVIRAAAPVGLLWLCVTLPFLAAIHAAPDQLVTLLVGTEFLSAAPGLMAAGISAVAFTLSYLLATFLAALNDRRGIWAVALMSFLQLALMYVTLCDPTTDVISLVTVKAGCQSLLAVAMCVYTLSRLRRRIGI